MGTTRMVSLKPSLHARTMNSSILWKLGSLALYADTNCLFFFTNEGCEFKKTEKNKHLLQREWLCCLDSALWHLTASSSGPLWFQEPWQFPNTASVEQSEINWNNSQKTTYHIITSLFMQFVHHVIVLFPIVQQMGNVRGILVLEGGEPLVQCGQHFLFVNCTWVLIFWFFWVLFHSIQQTVLKLCREHLFFFC